jgi:hypothetical protein
MFRIEFLPEDARDAGYLWRNGRIVLDDAEERFRALIHDWHEPDYERQWLEALTSIVGGASYSCLVTVLPPVGAREMAEIWPLLREGDEVRMRNTLVQPENVDRRSPCSAESESDFAESGPSEWRFSVADVERFLQSPSV